MGISDAVAVGRVGRPHGIKGAIRVALYHPGSQVLAERPPLAIEDTWHQVVDARAHSEGIWLVSLEGITSRNDAETLRGREVRVARSMLALGEGEVLVHDLVGYRVFDDAGSDLGIVEGTFHQGAHDVLVLSSGRMIPLVPAWITSLDEQGKSLVVVAYAEGP